MKVYDTNEASAGSLRKYIQCVMNINPDDLNVVMINATYDQSVRSGGELALKLPNTQPIILYWFGDQEQFHDDVEFQYALSKPHIHYFDWSKIITLKDLIERLQICGTKEVDSAVAILAERRAMISDFGGLLHGWESLSEEVQKNRLDLMRKKWAPNKTDDEILNLAMTCRVEEPGIFADQYFDGTFCDIEGTLINSSRVNLATKLLLEKKQANGKKVRLWTGGDKKSYGELLKTFDITWQLFSKSDFSGATAEEAIDDKPQELANKHNIKVTKLIDVKDI